MSAAERIRARYAIVNLTGDQLQLLVEGLAMARLYQQRFIDVDGRAKLTRIKRLEKRMRKWQERYPASEDDQ